VSTKAHSGTVFPHMSYKYVVWSFNPYCPKRPCAGLENVLANGLSCHILLFACLLGRNLNVLTKPEKLRLSERYN